MSFVSVSFCLLLSVQCLYVSLVLRLCLSAGRPDPCPVRQSNLTKTSQDSQLRYFAPSTASMHCNANSPLKTLQDSLRILPKLFQDFVAQVLTNGSLSWRSGKQRKEEQREQRNCVFANSSSNKEGEIALIAAASISNVTSSSLKSGHIPRDTRS